jgi:hypothetical protein
MIGGNLVQSVLSGTVRQVSVVIDGITARPMHITDITHSARVLQFAKLAAALNAASACVKFALATGNEGTFIGTFTWPIEMDIDRLPAIVEALRHTPLQVR